MPLSPTQSLGLGGLLLQARDMFGGRGSGGTNPFLTMAFQQQQAKAQADQFDKLLSQFGGGQSPVPVSAGAPPAPSASPGAAISPGQAQALRSVAAFNPQLAQQQLLSHMFKTPAKPTERRIVQGADQYKYYADTGDRVLPGVEAAAPPGQPHPFVKLVDAYNALSEGDPTRKLLFGKIKKETAQEGLSLEVDADGNISFRQGPGVTGGGALSKRTEGELETRLMDLGDVRQSITAIQQRFDPALLELSSKAGVAWSEFKSKLGVASPEDRRRIDEFVPLRAESAQMFSNILKALSGVAVSPTEFKRAESYIPYTGTGVFDGDSPDTFQAKLGRMEEFTDKAMARYRYLRNQGFTDERIKSMIDAGDAPDLDSVPDLINRRGEELDRQLQGSQPGLDPEQRKAVVVEQLGKEFGLVAE